MIGAIIVLYNPTGEVRENILTYINEVEKLYIIDNSPINHLSTWIDLIDLGKVCYHHQGENLGIANALNKGCKLAIHDGVEWVLTMDQDSKFTSIPISLSKIVDSVHSNIGIVYPNYLINGTIYDSFIKNNGVNLVTMTSGNLLNLNIYQALGPFREDFFIDYVDIEYCLRMRRFGYELLQIKDLVLMHGLGQTYSRKIFGKIINITNHNHVRRYYITRNRFSVMQEYYNDFKMFNDIEYKVFFNDLAKILLFETDRLKKIWSIYRGYMDFKKNRYGAYKYEK